MNQQAPLRRGDKQRQAILTAARELLTDLRFEDLSVSAITERAGITRSGFYFYFDSKHAVLATLMEHCVVELEELTQHFAARSAGETPQAFVKRMLASTAAVFAHNRPVMTASFLARGTDEQIRAVMDRLTDSVFTQVQRHVADEVSAGTAMPISDDVGALARMLSAATQLVLAGDTTFVEAVDGVPRALRVLEELWLHAFWSPSITHQSALK